jgi:tRNA pseudouridine38-40 synthase
MRYFLQIAYKGTHYHGWQVQNNAITVQGIIQERLEQILQKSVWVTGSSRTDAGVHAQQQWAHVDLEPQVDPDQLCYHINAILPHDMVILAIRPVVDQAHARFDALTRSYEYAILPIKNPFLIETHYLLQGKLDLETINKAAAILCHKTDFTSFSKIGSGLPHYQCSVKIARWIRLSDGRLIFNIQANRFLRGMVRSIVSNLLQVGLGKVSVSAFETLIDQKDRRLGASLVPACGLTLREVTYPNCIFIK